MRYEDTTARDGERVVHNFPPRKGQAFGDDGFRYWTEPIDEAQRTRCYCDWTAVAAEHYGTVFFVEEPGGAVVAGRRRANGLEEADDG